LTRGRCRKRTIKKGMGCMLYRELLGNHLITAVMWVHLLFQRDTVEWHDWQEDGVENELEKESSCMYIACEICARKMLQRGHEKLQRELRST
jgi:hypothetical protein